MAAQSAADLRALVAAANQTVAEFQAAARLAIAKAQEASQAYRVISDKVAPAAVAMVMAESRVEESIVHSLQALESANAYNAVL